MRQSGCKNFVLGYNAVLFANVSEQLLTDIQYNQTGDQPNVKIIFHPKMKVLLLFIDPFVVSMPFVAILLVEHKKVTFVKDKDLPFNNNFQEESKAP